MPEKIEVQPSWLAKLNQSPWALTIVVVGGILTGLAASTEAIDKLMLFVGAKPNALQLSRDDERARFSRIHTCSLASSICHAALRLDGRGWISSERSRPRLGAVCRDF